MTTRFTHTHNLIHSTLPSAAEAVWIAALLAVYGRTAAVRDRARTIFMQTAQWAFYGLLSRTTGPRVSLGFLQRLTAQAATRLLERWSHERSGPFDTFLLQLQCALDEVMFGPAREVQRYDECSTGIGILWRVRHEEQRALVERVRGHLAPAMLAELLVGVEVNSWSPSGASTPARARTEDAFEAALLMAAGNELGIPLTEADVMRAA